MFLLSSWPDGCMDLKTALEKWSWKAELQDGVVGGSPHNLLGLSLWCWRARCRKLPAFWQRAAALLLKGYRMLFFSSFCTVFLILSVFFFFLFPKKAMKAKEQQKSWKQFCLAVPRYSETHLGKLHWIKKDAFGSFLLLSLRKVCPFWFVKHLKWLDEITMLSFNDPSRGWCHFCKAYTTCLVIGSRQLTSKCLIWGKLQIRTVTMLQIREM